MQKSDCKRRKSLRRTALANSAQSKHCRRKLNIRDCFFVESTKALKSEEKSAALKLYERAFSVIGERTPLFEDCGVLCGKACCKGDGNTGMRLFPCEETSLPVFPTLDGGRLCVCNGTCDRKDRPLGCRIFPLFPILHDDGHISAELDIRGYRVCPLTEHANVVRFSADFRKAVRRAGRILCRDKRIRDYIKEVSEEIMQTARLYGVSYQISKRK